MFDSLFTSRTFVQRIANPACAAQTEIRNSVQILDASPLPARWNQHMGALQVCAEIRALWDLLSGGILIPLRGAPDATTETQVEDEEVSPCTSICWELWDTPAQSSSILQPQCQTQASLGFTGSEDNCFCHIVLWGHEVLREELMGSQRKIKSSGVSRLLWLTLVLQLPVIFKKRLWLS